MEKVTHSREKGALQTKSHSFFSFRLFFVVETPKTLGFAEEKVAQFLPLWNPEGVPSEKVKDGSKCECAPRLRTSTSDDTKRIGMENGG